MALLSQQTDNDLNGEDDGKKEVSNYEPGRLILQVRTNWNRTLWCLSVKPHRSPHGVTGCQSDEANVEYDQAQDYHLKPFFPIQSATDPFERLWNEVELLHGTYELVHSGKQTHHGQRFAMRRLGQDLVVFHKLFKYLFHVPLLLDVALEMVQCRSLGHARDSRCSPPIGATTRGIPGARVAVAAECGEVAGSRLQTQERTSCPRYKLLNCLPLLGQHVLELLLLPLNSVQLLPGPAVQSHVIIFKVLRKQLAQPRR
mmetsp:Transcript_38244/g.69620  ORF Transcript_38244/g.69620 Transcript_38244/m.69620 type:complete len:257 (+) Transcript_38244:431-1201(+)